MFILLASLLGSTACQTSKTPEIPKITRETPLEEGYGYAVAYGGQVLQQFKEVSREKQQMAEVHRLAEADLLKKNEEMDPLALVNVSNLYRASTSTLSSKLLTTLLHSRSDASRRIGWRLAALRPSAEIGQTIEGYLTESLGDNSEDRVLSPEMAIAIQENNLKSAFTFLIRGLLKDGQPEYANAMLALDPVRAAGPFVDYLGKADLDDLRQLSQENINIYTCTIIFRYLLDNPLPINHPSISQLFLFAVSRNRAVADMANSVLEKHIPEHRIALSIILSRMPVQVQMAFVEGSQREMTANLRLFLNDFKDAAQQKEVIEELNSGQRDVAQ